MTARLAWSLLLALPLYACAERPAAEADPAPAVPLFSDLGTHHWAITANPEAQRYFDQGMRLVYAFNHAEAIRAFDEAARLDPTCAMCSWGAALAYGPNINAGMDATAGVAAFAALKSAQNRSGAAARERALIDALAVRYADPPPAARAPLDSAYARAMGTLHEDWPEDVEIAVLYAESLMDLSPWNYWNPDGSPRPDTERIVATLEEAIARAPDHPGACHYYIHAVEAAHPGRAVECAERLAGAMPGAGHLVHMPAHIYIRVGRYADAITANEHAVHADETYMRDQQPGVGTYSLGYYPHNYDFLAFAASMAGRAEQALSSARKAESLVPPEMLGTAGMGFLEQGATGSLRVLVRFGRWEEILGVPEPAAGLVHARGIWHWARGMAQAARGGRTEAESELQQVRAAAAVPAAAGLIVGYNSSAAVLDLAGDVLEGEIAARNDEPGRAIGLLRMAAAKEDALTYGEPPDWPTPVRHHLGAVLLDARRAPEAEVVYREDLRRFPDNGWSLTGLEAALRLQGKVDEAAGVAGRLRAAWSGADVEIARSRF